MKIYNSLDAAVCDKESSFSLAIGNFDGIHLGHRKVIKQADNSPGEKTVLITFYPHPKKILSPEYAPELILTRQEKFEILEKTGVDMLIDLPFEKYVNMSAVDFMDSLYEKIPIKSVSVGYNFFFGKEQSGNPEILLWWSRSKNVRISVCDAVIHKGMKVSSSAIRNLILRGKIQIAADLLGTPYMMHNKIVSGRREGRQMDFPTINISPPEKIIPCDGVYITTIVTESGTYPAVTNIGQNPTIDRESRSKTVETYVPYKNLPSLYGSVAGIYFFNHIRSEITFSSTEKLRKKIAEDVQKAIEFWKNHSYDENSFIEINKMKSDFQ
ncbi:MAG: bifunctional riboflavin kinase/FAD synthetase [bacterium]